MQQLQLRQLAAGATFWPQQQRLLPRPQQHPAGRRARASVVRRVQGTPDGGTLPAGSPGSDARLLRLGGMDAIYIAPLRQDVGPSYDLSKEQAVELQLQALKNNDKPTFDHGIEVMYRFANFDPFQRSKYFGKSFDLGQFERFRRIMHIPAYKPLLNHEEWKTLSTLKLSESVWKTRVLVVGEYGKDRGVYEFTMVQRFGGRYDGWWFTDSLVADGNNWQKSIISY